MAGDAPLIDGSNGLLDVRRKQENRKAFSALDFNTYLTWIGKIDPVGSWTFRADNFHNFKFIKALSVAIIVILREKSMISRFFA